jgi:hypothetical protein
VAGESPGGGWTAYEKPSRPSAVFYPQQIRENGPAAGKEPAVPAAQKSLSGWQSSTSPRKAD